LDTFRVIGLFTKEANLEATRSILNPTNYIDTNGEFTRGVAGEAALSLYMLTRSKEEVL
jgi:hypothetical protein